MTPFYTDPLVTLYLGDCNAVMAELPDSSVDSVVCDPPYGLEFMGKEWDRLGAMPDRGPGPRGRNAFGGWHGTGVSRPNNLAQQAWHEAWATEAFRVLKPGGHLLAFGGTRTVHRLAAAIEDAGFEIRDMLMWIYASGFPKSLDVGKAMDKAAGAERELRPDPKWTERYPNGPGGNNNPTSIGSDGKGGSTLKRDVILTSDPVSDLARQWDGWGTALKPAHEPIVMARKPLVGTVAGNVARFGTGALNIGATRIGTEGGGTHCSDFPEPCSGHTGHGRYSPTVHVQSAETSGRWPSNVMLSDPELFDSPNPEVVGSGATSGGGEFSGPSARLRNNGLGLGESGLRGGSSNAPDQYGDSGGYSRFFLVPKAPVTERMVDGQRGTHPTQKPVDLMRHLLKLVTPPGGVALDPFGGSGTTAVAASLEGMRCILIEREEEYIIQAKGRLIATPMGLGLDVGAPVRRTGAKQRGNKDAHGNPTLGSKRNRATNGYEGGWGSVDATGQPIDSHPGSHDGCDIVFPHTHHGRPAA